MVEERGFVDRVVDTMIYLIAMLLALLCLFPFVTVIAESLSAAAPLRLGMVTFWPVGFNLDNYGVLLRDSRFLGSFGISLLRVLVAVPITLLMCALTAYPFSHDRIEMPGRGFIKVLLIFGMMFSGGLVPTFISYRWLGLLDRFAVLILPGALNIFYAILMINFFRGLPDEIYESAVLDGASHFQVLFKIYLPLSIPSLATISVFTAVGHWNSWFDGILYLNKPNLWPLQSYLYTRVMGGGLSHYTGRGQADEAARGAVSFAEATPVGMRAAMILIAAIPIILVYPFMQQYFVRGLTLGAVKG